jgi:hypothetical protein
MLVPAKPTVIGSMAYLAGLLAWCAVTVTSLILAGGRHRDQALRDGLMADPRFPHHPAAGRPRAATGAKRKSESIGPRT